MSPIPTIVPKMMIPRPNSATQIFEGIPNCFVGHIDGTSLYPPGRAVSSLGHPLSELVFESAPPPHDTKEIEISEESLRFAVKEASGQYLERVGRPQVEGRFQDYLTEEIGLSRSAAIELLREKGLAPFLHLTRVFVSVPHSAICLDFACFGEEYLNEYGFSLDWLSDRVEFVTPRELMAKGSYPASRRNQTG